MREPFDFDLLDRFLSGSASADERALLEQAAAGSPELRQLLEAMSSAVREDAGGWNTERAIADFNKRRKRRPAYWGLGLAAAAILVVAVGIGVLQRPRMVEDLGPPTAAAMQEYRSLRGQHRAITLEDGSRVVLSAGSLLRVSLDGSNRTVHLEGEAFFDVKPDPSRPFVVLSGAAQTRVLGTSFTVNAHRNGAVDVAVLTGRVELRRKEGSATQAAVLTPGQAGRLEGDAQIAVRSVDANDYIAWQEGRLVFRDVSLEEVTATLERWYDVDFEIRDAALARSHVTAFLEKQTLAEVVDVLAETLGAGYSRTGNRITFYRK